ncbi:MAG: bifunctional 4-hydroxy-2-oxoglutarate aldolase/2-dehydro-3-deoxy-phosphogluconate aldolase [Phycisphaerales bacterium]|nr:bifunctional 4-hydroxy-2-oxoglutarate aldolase/2-dehydro-3-deoxy-phosphogluconate aldolase [Phycisphaerales bacterium]MCB9841319.1 bifunctional 4-hydroxy-2-oxoglutarate aldolase/2-dehydro-3-deoxy-phosphogluconate aldolase [Phycisphaeraceae bacterium]
MDPAAFANAFRERRASAIIRTDSTDAARLAMDAAVRGGLTICEFTLTVPGALDLVGEFRKRGEKEGLLVGVGTVLTPEDAVRSVDAGAQFLVSPAMDPAVIAAAGRLGVSMMPGCATPSEMLAAHRAGARLQKLFPAVPNGPSWVAQTLAPLSMLRIVPTSGVTVENAADYLRAGAWAVGFVASLFEASDVRHARWDAIEARARAAAAAVGGVELPVR